MKFKLKKDGKAIGYLSLGPVFSIKGFWFRKVGCESWERCPKKLIDGDFDSAHPFVCPDKNGKDVYAGDKIKGNQWSPSKIVWDEKSLSYKLELTEGKSKGETYPAGWVNLKHFELIEEKDETSD